MQQLEKALDNVFKKAPQMSEAARKTLADALPWIALAVGVLSLVGAWIAYRAATFVTEITGGLIGNTYGLYAPSVAGNFTFLWVGVVLMLAQAVIALVAYPSLKARKKSGWNLLFLTEAIYAVYAVVYHLFAYVDIGQLIFSLLVTAVGLYLLFQVRGYYGGSGAPATTQKTESAPKSDKKS